MATKICPRCGAENDQKATYCVRCGTVLDDAANAASGPQATTGASAAANPAGPAPAQGASAQPTGPADPAQQASRQPEPPQGFWQGAPQYTFGQRPPKSGAYPPPYGQPGPAPFGASPDQQGANPANNAAQHAYQTNPEQPRPGPQDAYYQAGNPQYAYQPGQPPYPYPPREQHPFGQPDRIFGWYDGDFTPDASTPARSRVSGGVLAILLGLLGIHKFYLGQWGAGLICLLITLFFAWNAGWIVGLLFLFNLVEAILLFTMKPEEFQNKYHVRAE